MEFSECIYLKYKTMANPLQIMQILKNAIVKDKSVIRKQSGNQEAIIVLVGLGNLLVVWQKLCDGFAQIDDADIYVPDIISRESIGQSVERLHEFISSHDLAQYQKVHVFAYILGGRILNQYLINYNIHRLASIVYDRSPIQELAPIISTQQYPRLSKLMFGEIIHEVAKTPYRDCSMTNVSIGLLIESKVTPIMRFFKKHTSLFQPFDWSGEAFNQPYNDIMYLQINHNEMYWRFDVFINQIKRFYQTGNFGDNVQRIPYQIDPFVK